MVVFISIFRGSGREGKVGAFGDGNGADVVVDRFVDRIFAIWQALNPTEYVKRERSPWPTFTMPEGTEVDAETRASTFFLLSPKPLA